LGGEDDTELDDHEEKRQHRDEHDGVGGDLASVVEPSCHAPKSMLSVKADALPETTAAIPTARSSIAPVQ
jgi:hypothetical protein